MILDFLKKMNVSIHTGQKPPAGQQLLPTEQVPFIYLSLLIPIFVKNQQVRLLADHHP
jgi:hypothetical protein